MFTHGKDRPARFAVDYDGQIALNPVSLVYLVDAVGSDKPTLIEMPVADCFIKRPIVFGVSGHAHADGRKGERLVAEMVKAGYVVNAWGAGWPCEIYSDDVKDLPSFYATLDYYVDTSSDEGGCVPALECLAMGIPVISHTVGVDRPVLGYVKDSWVSLSQVLYRLTHPRTYDDWARDHAAYFKRVLGRG
jgi:glycosyltransferase involved in cell wall biosynthesis